MGGGNGQERSSECLYVLNFFIESPIALDDAPELVMEIASKNTYPQDEVNILHPGRTRPRPRDRGSSGDE